MCSDRAANAAVPSTPGYWSRLRHWRATPVHAARGIGADPPSVDRMGGSPMADHRLPGHRLGHGGGARSHPHLCPRDPALGGLVLSSLWLLFAVFQKDASYGVAPPRLVG